MKCRGGDDDDDDVRVTIYEKRTTYLFLEEEAFDVKFLLKARLAPTSSAVPKVPPMNLAKLRLIII